MRSGCRPRLRAALLALLLPAVCGACGGGTGRPLHGRGDIARAITVRDATGRTVALAAPPARIISLIPAATHILLDLGVGDRLVARTDYDTEPGLDTLPSVGGGLTPSLEWLVARRPDLVVAWPDRGTRDVVARLAATGIPVYGARMESLDDIRRTARDLGRLVGRGPLADSLVARMDRDLEDVRRSVAQMPRPRVLYLESVDPPLVAGSRTFLTQLLTIAGGDNVFADARTPWPQVSLEAVIRRRPQVILRPAADTAHADPLAALRATAGWSELPAVRDGRVFAVSEDRFDRPDLHVAGIARRMARLIHGAGPGRGHK